jgi:hypothetical protein
MTLVKPLAAESIEVADMTEGMPSSDRDDLERIQIRPSRMHKTLADVGGNGFVAEQFYTPYTLRHANGAPKYYLFSGKRRDLGHRFVAMHASGGWRGDWVVVDPAQRGTFPEWVIIK